MYRRCSGVTAHRLAAAAIAVAAALTMSGCSPGVDYSPLLPAGHDLPPPRADTTLDPLQVQQATEDLISERNHLTAEAQTPPPAAANARPAVTPVAVRAAGTSQSAASGAAAAPQSNETK